MGIPFPFHFGMPCGFLKQLRLVRHDPMKLTLSIDDESEWKSRGRKV